MLNSLEVLNGTIHPEFAPDVFEYDVDVDKDVLTLVFDCKGPEGSTITVHGNDYLTEGENHVLIEVYDKEVITYTLTVMKESSSEVSSLFDTSTKVEVNANDKWYKDLITPGISIVCFITIVMLFCIIFKKK